MTPARRDTPRPRRTVLLHLRVPAVDGLAQVSRETRLRFLESEVGRVRRLVLDRVAQIQRAEDTELEVESISGLFPVLRLTASESTIQALADDPNVENVTTPRVYFLASG